MTRRQIALWLGMAVAITVLAGGGYAVAQQVVRHDANHPQTEMARDAAARLGAGATPSSVLPDKVIDIRTSSDPYVIVLDQGGNVLASSMTLDGQTIAPPSGVLDYVSAHGEDVISWQPDTGVRSAIVVDAYPGGFVVAGRSLQATEELESNLGLWAGLAWAGAMVLLAGVAVARRVR